jgi:hypothetical protein
MNSNPTIMNANTALGVSAYDDLLLPVFSSEVLTRLPEFNFVQNMVKKRGITTGNTAKANRLGGLTAERKARGSRLLGQDTAQTEMSFKLDERPLVSHVRTEDLDESLIHFERRADLVTQTVQAIAEARESQVLRLLVNASRSTPTTLYGGASSPFPGGGINGAGAPSVSADFPTTAAGAWDEDAAFAVLASIDAIVTRWRKLRINPVGGNCVVPIEAWDAIHQLGLPKSGDDLRGNDALHVPPMFMNSNGWYGNQANMTTAMSASPLGGPMPLFYRGINIWWSNIFSADNVLQVHDTDEAKYQGDFSATRGIVFKDDAILSMEKLGVATRADYIPETMDWLIVSQYLGGGGTLRAESAVELAYSAV